MAQNSIIALIFGVYNEFLNSKILVDLGKKFAIHQTFFYNKNWTDQASLSGTSFISVFTLTIFTHREGLSEGFTPVPDNNVNFTTVQNQCGTQQGIYGVTSRVFILVLIGEDYDEGTLLMSYK